MTIVNVHEAKTHLSRLLEAAARGETVTIAKAGRPVAKLTRIATPSEPRRLGFLAGQAQIPSDFDTMAGTEIAAMFGVDA